MTASQLIYTYEQSFSEKTVIFGTPGGAFSPEEDAGKMIKELGLERAREIAYVRAAEFPAAWNHWSRVSEILAQTEAA
jgi:hypothetical protein